MVGRWCLLAVVLAGCNQILGIDDVTARATSGDDAPPDTPPGTVDVAPADTPPNVVYTVYAHADHVLYAIDLATNTLTTVGPFNAPVVGSVEDVITDLAVVPDGTIYVISQTQLYTADPIDGHVTLVGSTSACGKQTVALTATTDGRLWAGDFQGAICPIDLSTGTPVVGAPVTMQGGLALSGDLVAVSDGTVFGTAYRLSDPPGTGTQLSNLLVTVNPSTGAVVQIGTGTGYPKLFGIGYANGKVFGFAHDGTGQVITIDPASGVGTLFGTFVDPATAKGISFAGAGVNPRVSPH